MSKMKNSGLDQYGTEPFEQQQFGTAGAEGLNHHAHQNLADFGGTLSSYCLLNFICLKTKQTGIILI